MKNERMSLIVWSFCFLCLPVLLHRCVLHFCMLVLPAKDQHTSGVLLPFLLLQETEVSRSKTAEVQMRTLIPIFDNVVEAKTVKRRLSSSLPSSHYTPALHTRSKLLAMALSRFGDREKTDRKLCQLLKAFYPLWIFGCRRHCEKEPGLQLKRVGQSKAVLCPPSSMLHVAQYCGFLLPSVIGLSPPLLQELEPKKGPDL